MQLTEKQFTIAISGLFIVLSLYLVSYHELWIDEAYHYLLARDSFSLGQLFSQGTWSGHPLLWNLLLYFLKVFAPGISAMQVLHCLIAGGTVFMICRYAPFTRTEKCLMIFGYYIFYE